MPACRRQWAKCSHRPNISIVLSTIKEIRLKEAAKKVEAALSRHGLTVCDFSCEHYVRICTNNVIERLKREIRRSTIVVGCFPGGNSALLLICARLCQVAGHNGKTRKHEHEALEDRLPRRLHRRVTSQS